MNTYLDSDLKPYYSLLQEYLNGKKKHELTRWYLHTIEESVESYLKINYSYDPTACPENYIDYAPRDLGLIKSNLQIIHSLITTNTEEHRKLRIHFIDPLKYNVYVEIDKYVRNLETFLLSELGKIFKITEENDVVSTIRILCETTLHKYPKQLQDQVSESLKDLEYIRTMKLLEEQFFSDARVDTDKQLSDIVPISGLILGKLHRLENELKTVLDHWSRNTVTLKK